MITCSKCGRENVDDTVLQCGYCGAALKPVTAPPEGARPVGPGAASADSTASLLEEKKTLFGYAAMEAPGQGPPAGPSGDISKTIMDDGPPMHLDGGGQSPAGAGEPPQYTIKGVSPAESRAPAEPTSPHTMQGLSPQTSPPAPAASTPPQPYPSALPSPASLPPSAALGTQPPGEGVMMGSSSPPGAVPEGDQAGKPPSSAYQPTMMAPSAEEQVPPTELAPAAAPAGIPPTAPAPAAPPAGVPPTAPAPAAPSTEIPPTALAPAAPSPDIPSTVKPGSVEAAKVKARAAQSEEQAEPGRGIIRILMIIGGLLMIGIFAAPWGSTNDGLIFSWDLLKAAEGLAFISQIYLAAGGVVLVAGGVIPLPFYLLRAVIAVLLGLVPLVLYVVGASQWQSIVLMVVLVMMPAALLHRKRFAGSMLARILVALGVVMVLATMLIPVGGSLPLMAIFSGLGDLSGAALVVRLFPLALLLFSLLSLLVFLGRGSTGLALVWAILLLCYLPLQILLPTVIKLFSGGSVMILLPQFYSGLSMLIYLLLASYGVSQVLARINPRT